MDDGWWMMYDGWWMMDEGWWMRDDGWWMMDDWWLMIIDDYSGQIIIFHQPRFPWNKGISLPQLHFGVRSCEVAIIWPDDWWWMMMVVTTQGKHVVGNQNGGTLAAKWNAKLKRTADSAGENPCPSIPQASRKHPQASGNHVIIFCRKAWAASHCLSST